MPVRRGGGENVKALHCGPVTQLLTSTGYAYMTYISYRQCRALPGCANPLRHSQASDMASVTSAAELPDAAACGLMPGHSCPLY